MPSILTQRYGDNGTCQYYTGELNVVWSKTIEEAGEMWSMRPVSDGGFIMACGGAGDCENGTYEDPCEYYGQLVRLDVDGNVIWHKTYEGSSALYAARETSDGGFIAAGGMNVSDIWIVIQICLSSKPMQMVMKNGQS